MSDAATLRHDWRLSGDDLPVCRTCNTTDFEGDLAGTPCTGHAARVRVHRAKAPDRETVIAGLAELADAWAKNPNVWKQAGVELLHDAIWLLVEDLDDLAFAKDVVRRGL